MLGLKSIYVSDMDMFLQLCIGSWLVYIIANILSEILSAQGGGGGVGVVGGGGGLGVGALRPATIGEYKRWKSLHIINTMEQCWRRFQPLAVWQ